MYSHEDYFYTSNCNTGTYNCLGNLIFVTQLALRKYDEFYLCQFPNWNFANMKSKRTYNRCTCIVTEICDDFI